MDKEEIYWLLFAIALVLVGHFLVSLGIKFLRKEKNKRPWSRETAILQSIDIVMPLPEQKEENSQRYGYKRRYRYQFQGQKFDHVCVDYTDDEEEARLRASDHKPGDTVTLFVNRQNPETSRLGSSSSLTTQASYPGNL